MTAPKVVVAAHRSLIALGDPTDPASLLDRVFPPAQCDEDDPAVQRFMGGVKAPVAAHTLDRDRDEPPGAIRDSESRRWPLHHRYGVRSVA